MSTASNHSIYAQWTANTYTITFVYGNGSANTTKTVTYDSTYGTLPTPTRNGYNFLGWYNNNIKIENNTKVQILTNQTLTAKWEAKVYSFTYNGNYQTFNVAYTGKYKIELWGAQGGFSNGGYGGYTSGEIVLEANETFYIYIGGKGGEPESNSIGGAAGYNGGAKAVNNASSGGNSYGGGGGGATDIRITNGTWNNFNSLKSRIMVAAGGGGGCSYSSALPSGGGINGYNGTTTSGSYGPGGYGLGATQTSGGSCYINNSYANGNNCKGTFGYANQVTYYSSTWYNSGGGGGGGYYGGGSSPTAQTSYSGGTGGGGSSFISGHNGCNAISSSSTASSIYHTGNANHYSGYIFSNTNMIDGLGYNWTSSKGSVKQMPNPNGGYYQTGIGHAGNGYARITYIGD